MVRIMSLNDVDLSYRNLLSAFRKIVDNQASLQARVQRGNHARLMNLQLQKAIYAKSRLTKSLRKILPLKIELMSKNKKLMCFHKKKDNEKSF